MPQVPTVGLDELPDDAVLVDVREDDEWAAGHAPAAHHLPMMDIPVRMAEVPTDGDVVVVCRSGARSAQVVAYLTGHGWDNVRNLDGGMIAWARAGRPIVSEAGGAPQIA